MLIQDEYDLYTRMYEADKKELAKLQAHFEILEKQYDAIMEERRLAEEEKARKEEEERKQNKAAAAIQAAWRGYQFRILMRSKSKKAVKKGKGKKWLENMTVVISCLFFFLFTRILYKGGVVLILTWSSVTMLPLADKLKKE